jgi:hypothetical protein
MTAFYEAVTATLGDATASCAGDEAVAGASKRWSQAPLVKGQSDGSCPHAAK